MQPFRIYLTPTTDQSFQAIVYDSPAGQAAPVEASLLFIDEVTHANRRRTVLKMLESRTFQPQVFDDGEQAWLLRKKLLSQNGDKKSWRPQRFEIVGQELYDSLFPAGSQAADRLKVAIGLAENEKARLVLEIKIDAGFAPRLADYPWELLHDGRGFLALRRVCITRYIAFDAVPLEIPRLRRLNVLLISSSATDPANGLGSLPTEERLAVKEGLARAGQAGHIKLTTLAAATRKGLRQYLTDCDPADLPNVVHFDGHGFFGKRCTATREDENGYCYTMHFMTADTCRVCGAELPAAQGFVLFEAGKSPAADYVSAGELANLLFQNNLEGKLGLVVLSACKSGLALGEQTVFNGVAQSLIGVRIPAVVGMQFSVNVEGAAEFAGQFYRALGARNALAGAVGQGREAMGGEGDQWYRPALYLRWQDAEGGQLFATDNPATTAPAPQPPIPGPVIIPPITPKATSSVTVNETALHKLPFGEKMQLVNLLLACPSFSSRAKRDTTLSKVRGGQVMQGVSHSDVDKFDVINILDRTLITPGAFEELLGVIRVIDGDVYPVQALEEFVTKASTGATGNG